MTDGPLLVLDEVSLRNGAQPVLGDVSLAIPRGASLALLGDGGSGKSALARVALGLLQPDLGTVRFDGQKLTSAHRRRLGLLAGEVRAAFDPRWTLAASIAEARGLAAADALALAGLPPDIGAYVPRSLDAATGQRAGLARALATSPDLLVCDEPAAGLDSTARADLLDLLRTVQARQGLTLLVLTRDPQTARRMGDLAGVLHRGRLVEFGAAAAVFARPRHPYTRQALGLPDATPPRAMLAVGASGCALHPRCPLAAEVCRRAVPLLQFADGAAVACHAVAEGRA